MSLKTGITAGQADVTDDPNIVVNRNITTTYRRGLRLYRIPVRTGLWVVGLMAKIFGTNGANDEDDRR